MKRQRGGKRADDLRGEFTVVAVPGTHRDRTRSRYGNDDNKSRNRLSKVMKQKILLEQRVAGRSWREAAKVAGYRSVGAAYTAAQEAIRDIPREAADEARSIEMQRIDEVVRANWTRMQTGDPDAGNLILRAIDRRARLLGLDLAEPSPTTVFDVTLQALVMRLVAAEPVELEAELQERLSLLAADNADDDQRKASGNGTGDVGSRQAVVRSG